MRTRTILAIVLLAALAAVCGAVTYVTLARPASVELGEPARLALAAFVILAAAVAYRAFRLAAIYPLLVIMGLTYALSLPYFAPTDEENHFAVARYIAVNHKLPQILDDTPPEVLAMADHIYPALHEKDPSQVGLEGKLYEAQHPPLYYLLAAGVLAVGPAELVIDLYALRLIALACLILTAFIVIKTFRFASAKGMIPSSEPMFFALLAMLLLAPGVVVRMTTLSYLNLAMPLSALMLHFLVKLPFEKHVTLKHHVLGLGLLAGALAMTNSVAIVLLPVAAACLFLRTRLLKPVLQMVAIAVALSIPWLVMNLRYYGTLTAFESVRPLVEPLTNPILKPFGIPHLLEKTPQLFQTFWNPEEIGQARKFVPAAIVLLASMSVAALVTAAGSAIFILRKRVKRHDGWVCGVSLGLVLLNLLFLAVEGGFTWQGVVLGRYLYVTLPGLLFVFYISASRAGRIGKWLCLAGLAASLFLWANFLVNILGRVTWRV